MNVCATTDINCNAFYAYWHECLIDFRNKLRFVLRFCWGFSSFGTEVLLTGLQIPTILNKHTAFMIKTPFSVKIPGGHLSSDTPSYPKRRSPKNKFSLRTTDLLKSTSNCKLHLHSMLLHIKFKVPYLNTLDHTHKSLLPCTMQGTQLTLLVADWQTREC